MPARGMPARGTLACGMLGIALAALLIGPVARAEEGGWGVAGAFADLEPGGRAAGLAGAVFPLVDDPTAAHWNPARLVCLDQRGLAATYADLFGLHLVRHTALFFAFPRREREVAWEGGRWQAQPGAVGSAYAFGLQATRVDLDPESYAEYDLSAAYARRSAWGLAWGLTAHGLFVRSDLADVSASGFSTDLALSRSLSHRADASLVVRSLFSTLNWSGGDTKESLRPMVQIGVALKPHDDLALPAVATYDVESSALSDVALGAEWRAVGELLQLRAGARWHDDGSSAEVRGAAGAGLRWNDVLFDYGFTMGPEALGDTHRFSLQLRF